MTNLPRLFKYWFFWLLLILVCVFASELRLSLEYFLISAGLYAYSLSPSWQQASLNLRKIILLVSFLGYFAIDYFGGFYLEEGSGLMWLPVFLAIYFPLSRFDWQKYKKATGLIDLGLYFVSFLTILFSNKRATLISFLASLKNLFSKKLLLLFSILAVLASFALQDNIAKFYKISIHPRVMIWQGALKGFQEKPIGGHGFGTYAIDFPPYRIQKKGVQGSRRAEYIVHGHGQIFHQLFESGIFGLALVILLLYIFARYHANAFLPFLLLALFNVPVHDFCSFLLLGLLLQPLEIKEKFLQAKIPLNKFLKLILTFVTFVLLAFSTLSHYFFDMNMLSYAVKYDPWHPLYRFSRGAKRINKDIYSANNDLAAAVLLSPGVDYMHGFYAASLLGTENIPAAKYHIEKALGQMGNDPYLLLLSSFINQDKPDLAKTHFQKAIKLNPDIEKYLHDPSYSADEYIGVDGANPRITSFYRRGREIYLPLPYIEVE